MPFVIGETIGPYRLTEQLGQGGMATVYQAYHAALDRYVALKALHPALLDDPNFLVRFQREARLVAKLEHPNIVPVYDFSEYEGRPFLVMKYIEGRTLKARLDEGPLSTAEVLIIAEAVGAALQFAHEQNILHRDVKPSNVMLAKDGQIYLADFGLARIAQGGSSTLTSDMLIGTPQYISPEQAQSRPDLDARTDIYSFGVMLYQMFVGRLPFTADTPYSIIHDHIFTPLPLPRKVNPAVSADIERVLLKALAKEPADRFASVAEMIQALRAAVHAPVPPATPGETFSISQAVPVTAVPAVSTAASKPKKRPVWPWIAGAAALVLCLALAAAILPNLGKLKSAQSSPTAESTKANAPGGGASGLPADIQTGLDQAMAKWSQGKTSEAEAAMAILLARIGDNPAGLSSAAAYLTKNNSWVLAGMVESDLYRRHPKDLTPEQLQKFHEIIYMAGSDPNAQQLFTNMADNPLIQVGRMRSTLYFGGGPSAIQTELDKLLGQPLVLRRFPEARLLDIELSIQKGDKAGAQAADQALLNERTNPDWVLKQARSLETKFK